jgi:hypothetical protein
LFCRDYFGGSDPEGTVTFGGLFTNCCTELAILRANMVTATINETPSGTKSSLTKPLDPAAFLVWV